MLLSRPSTSGCSASPGADEDGQHTHGKTDSARHVTIPAPNVVMEITSSLLLFGFGFFFVFWRLLVCSCVPFSEDTIDVI